MKKRILTTIIAAAVIALPTIASAATALKGDFDSNGVVCYDDYNELKLFLSSNRENEKTSYDVDENGVVNVLDLVALAKLFEPTHITGDVNGDGVVSLEDVYLIESAIPKNFDPVFDEDGNYVNITYNHASPLIFDEENADVNKDGYVNLDDMSAVRGLVPESDLMGDVNSDGVVDMKDLVAFDRFLNQANYPIKHANGDINGDKNLDRADYVRIKHMIQDAQ